MASQRRKRRFTVIDVLDRTKVIVASSRKAAWGQDENANLVIDGTFKSVGGRRISANKKPKTVGGIWNDSDAETRKELKRGVICTLVVDDPIVIAKATFIGRRYISGSRSGGTWHCLIFQKNGVTFWVDENFAEFSRINGKRVG